MTESVQPPVNPETGTASPHCIPVPLDDDGRPDVEKWGLLLTERLGASHTLEEMDDWMRSNKETILLMLRTCPYVYSRLQRAYDNIRYVTRIGLREEVFREEAFRDRISA